jgi:flagellar biosynthesis anti-sigma factor FlgM
MRIDDKNTGGLGPSELSRAQATEAAGRSGTGAARRSGGGDGTDLVNLSSLAERVSALGQNSPERQARLDRLRSVVEAGQYQPDAEAISESIIQEAIGDSSPQAGQ